MLRPNDRVGPDGASGPAPNTLAVSALSVAPILEQPADTPPYQLLPPLTSDEYAALKADIQANGVLVPITVDQHGVIIDGHHRQQIASALGMLCPRVVQQFTSDEKRYQFALGLNLKRRHLNREQMRQLIAAECERTPDASDREIARRLGCSPSTVGAVRRPVSKLDTREEAEARTEDIRSILDRIDQDCIDLLSLGVPPTTVAEMLKQIWAEAAQRHNDTEINDAMWRHVVAPRIEAILNGGSS